MATMTDPFSRFGEIHAQALALGIKNPDAMVLCTVDKSGQPSSRQVLLKHFDPEGFVFYTNFESRKGRELRDNPHVSLGFYWRELGEQINIRGRVEVVSDEQADAYFSSRDRGSQLGAWASQQSRPLESRARLVAEVAKVESRNLGRKVPRPPYWGGFRVVPEAIEFWTERRFRLHDRFVYERSAEGWTAHRLYP